MITAGHRTSCRDCGLTKAVVLVEFHGQIIALRVELHAWLQEAVDIVFSVGLEVGWDIRAP